jgi:predicted acetyltransferase
MLAGKAQSPPAAIDGSGYRRAMPQTIRPITADELATWFEAFGTSFYIWPTDPQAAAELRRPTVDYDRTIGAFEGDAIVGTFRTFSTQLTLPGGGRVAVNAVSGVSVRPTHRRRGTLGRMIEHDVARATERGDVACILIASEWPIYGRFGYGPATWKSNWTLRTRSMSFSLEPTGSVEMVSPTKALELLPGIFAGYAAAQPGEIDRPDNRWEFDLGLVEWPGRPRWRGQVAIHRDADGLPDGFARFHGEENWGDGGMPDHAMLLDELHGVTPAAELDLWRFLAQVDLTAVIKAENRRTQEPLSWYLADARAARPSGQSDFLWVRPLDVPGLLAARRYDRDASLVLEVTDVVDDEPGPAAGRYRLEVRDGTATCERTEAEPDLTVEARQLGAASLGGTSLIDATRRSGAPERRAGALREADLLFRAADPPWCSTWF